MEKFIFDSADHAREKALQCQRFYPARKGYECREAVAAMCGFTDWEEMLSAIEAGPASAYDEFADESTLDARYHCQFDILMNKVAHKRGRNPELLADADNSPATRFKVAIWNSSLKFATEYAWAVVLELGLTAKKAAAYPPFKVQDPTEVLSRVDMFTDGICAWFRKNNRFFVTGRSLIEAFEHAELNVSSAVDLLRMLSSWGRICYRYQKQIPVEIQYYGLFVLAKRLSDLEFSQSEAAAELEELPSGAYLATRREALLMAFEHKTIYRLLKTQVRLDLALAWNSSQVNFKRKALKGGQWVAKLWVRDA